MSPLVPCLGFLISSPEIAQNSSVASRAAGFGAAVAAVGAAGAAVGAAGAAVGGAGAAVGVGAGAGAAHAARTGADSSRAAAPALSTARRLTFRDPIVDCPPGGSPGGTLCLAAGRVNGGTAPK